MAFIFGYLQCKEKNRAIFVVSAARESETCIMARPGECYVSADGERKSGAGTTMPLKQKKDSEKLKMTRR